MERIPIFTERTRKRMSEKLEMMPKDVVRENIEKLRAVFPNAVTETKQNGEVRLAVDFDVLKQEFSGAALEGARERYMMTWPDKEAAKALAFSQIRATLRPVREKSLGFDATQNLYLEGDNLNILKLLREPYLGKIKMIYIDPPYNTGSDLLYEDDFMLAEESYKPASGQFDDLGNRLYQNPESNGRFHTDWLNMIYPRLRVAKDLLAEDGAIFISIGDHELARLIEIGDELFSARNRLPIFNRITKKSSNSGNNFSPCVDYVVAYARDIDKIKEFCVDMDEAIRGRYNKQDEYVSERGPYQEVGLYQAALKHGGSSYPISCPDGEQVLPPAGKPWRWNEAAFQKGLREGRIVFKRTETSPLVRPDGGNGHWNVYTKVYLKEREERGMHPKNFSDAFQNALAAAELAELGIPFDFAKPVALVKYFAGLLTEKEDIVLDFFSGSGTTAQAVMQLNAEDGGKRRFIMVQLPEPCDERSEARRAGFRDICEIGEERIRRAGKKISEKNPLVRDLDVGFRVFRLDDSNMRDVYYHPEQITQPLLKSAVNNIREDRTSFDLLFQVLLELGIMLSAKIEEKSVGGKTYYAVNGNELIACFDDGITDETIAAIAKAKPDRAVFRDGCFSSDSVGINNEQLFKTYSPNTVIRVL